MLGCGLLLIFWTSFCFVHSIPTRPNIRIANYLDIPWPLRKRPLSRQEVATLANLGRSFLFAEDLHIHLDTSLLLMLGTVHSFAEAPSHGRTLHAVKRAQSLGLHLQYPCSAFSEGSTRLAAV